MVKFRKSFLRRLRTETEGDRSGWQRFVFVRLEAADALPMSPRLQTGATLLIDRHYNALSPYRKGEFNMYAVLKNDSAVVRYVEVAQDHLILRPHSESSPIEVTSIELGKRASDSIVGRISYVGFET
jgi:hypothetical protein